MGFDHEVGELGTVWAEVAGRIDHDALLCDFCNHPDAVAERGTIRADYLLKVGHSGAAYICDFCLDGFGE